jgi:hypothetical protein
MEPARPCACRPALGAAVRVAVGSAGRDHGAIAQGHERSRSTGACVPVTSQLAGVGRGGDLGWRYQHGGRQDDERCGTGHPSRVWLATSSLRFSGPDQTAKLVRKGPPTLEPAALDLGQSRSRRCGASVPSDRTRATARRVMCDPDGPMPRAAAVFCTILCATSTSARRKRDSTRPLSAVGARWPIAVGLDRCAGGCSAFGGPARAFAAAARVGRLTPSEPPAPPTPTTSPRPSPPRPIHPGRWSNPTGPRPDRPSDRPADRLRLAAGRWQNR